MHVAGRRHQRCSCSLLRVCGFNCGCRRSGGVVRCGAHASCCCAVRQLESSRQPQAQKLRAGGAVQFCQQAVQSGSTGRCHVTHAAGCASSRRRHALCCSSLSCCCCCCTVGGRAATAWQHAQLPVHLRPLPTTAPCGCRLGTGPCFSLCRCALLRLAMMRGRGAQHRACDPGTGHRSLSSRVPFPGLRWRGGGAAAVGSAGGRRLAEPPAPAREEGRNQGSQWAQAACKAANTQQTVGRPVTADSTSTSGRPQHIALTPAADSSRL